MEFKELDEMLSRVSSELSGKEKQLEMLISDVNRLKTAVRTLEDARALLINGRSSSEAYDLKVRKETAVSLQAEILRCLRSSGRIGLTNMELVAALKTFGYPNSERRSFYSNVFTTVQRLVERGLAVVFISDGKKKKYAVPAFQPVLTEE